MKLVAFTTILLVGKLSGRACPPEELLYFCHLPTRRIVVFLPE